MVFQSRFLDDDETVTVLDLYLYEETEKAILVAPAGYDDPDKVWFPKSLTTWDMKEQFDKGTVSVPVWLARKEEIDLKWGVELL